MARIDFHKVIVGRAELLHFMDFAIEDIPAKVDTGAYNSAVHADHIKLIDGGKALEFRLLSGHPLCGDLAATMTTKKFQTVAVINSFGTREERYEVKLRVKLGPKVFVATFSLADRSKMTYPILLGRKLLNNRFLVDTAETQVDRLALKQMHNIDFPIDEEGKAETV